MVEHVSMHGVVLNSLGPKKYNITAATPTPPGGVILRKPGSQEPAGLVMETAFLPIFSSMPKPTMEQSMAALEKGQKIYAAAGITTAHEGASHLPGARVSFSARSPPRQRRFRQWGQNSIFDKWKQMSKVLS